MTPFERWLAELKIAVYWRLAHERRDHYARAYLVRAFVEQHPGRRRLQVLPGGACPLV